MVQTDVEEKGMKRREQQAEYDRVHEIHQDRLESLVMDAQDHTKVLPASSISLDNCACHCLIFLTQGAPCGVILSYHTLGRGEAS